MKRCIHEVTHTNYCRDEFEAALAGREAQLVPCPKHPYALGEARHRHAVRISEDEAAQRTARPVEAK